MDLLVQTVELLVRPVQVLLPEPEPQPPEPLH